MYGPTTTSDAMYESINGASRALITAPVTAQWQWVAGRSYTLTAGLQSVELGGREAQARADRLLLTNDATFVPTGFPVVTKTGAPGTADSYVHTGLTNGTTYSYNLFAQDASGNVGPAAKASTQAQDVTAPAAVQNLRRTDKH